MWGREALLSPCFVVNLILLFEIRSIAQADLEFIL